MPLLKLPKNVRDLGKLIVAKGLKKLPKLQKIAQSGHTGCLPHFMEQTCAHLNFTMSFGGKIIIQFSQVMVILHPNFH